MEKQIILDILSYAIRAPSTHNSQPWLFKIKESGLDVFIDPKYFLPEADKDSRDLHISIGCMLENLAIASSSFGYESQITYGPFSEKNKKAEILFVKSYDTSFSDKNLFDVILKRVNARGKFLNQNIPDDIKMGLINVTKNDDNVSVNLISEKEKIIKIASVTKKAMHIAYKNVSFRKEMSKWMNSSLSTKKEGLPGYSLKMPLIVSLFIPFIIRFFNIGKFLGFLNFKSISSAPMIVVLSAPDDVVSWIKVGRLAERAMLYVQSKGYQSSIYVGAIEMGDLYKEVQEILGDKFRPQFLFLTGKIPGNHRITPRHNIEDKII